ncbi:MAG: YjfB family protein [Lachnospirales bacterium]
MDIAALSIAMSSAKVGQQVSISMLKQSMESAEQQSAALMKMMDTVPVAPVDPNSAGLLDVSV